MIRSLLRQNGIESRAMQVLPWNRWGDNAIYGSAAGMDVNTDSSLQLLAVYGSVQLISDTIATLPRDIYRGTGSDKQEVTIKPGWFDQPNPRLNSIEFLTQTLMSLLLDGNCYWAYSVDGNFAPTSIDVLDPLKMEIRPQNPGMIGSPVVYIYNGAPFNGRLLHIKGLMRPGALKGMSPVESARQSIGIGLAVQEFAGNFYKNGTTVSGVIQTPGPLTQDQAKDLKSNWSQSHGSAQNSHLPGVLTNGATWTSISVTPEQAQFLESRNFQAGEIAAMMFLLDPSMLGIAAAGTRGQNLTYSNLADRGQHMVTYTLTRWIIRLEQAFSFLLPKPQYMKFNVDAIVRADLLTRYQAHRIALGPDQPFEVVNEIRALEDLSPMAGFDTLEKPVVAPAPPLAVPDMVPAGAATTEPAKNEFHVHLGDVNVQPAQAEVRVPIFVEGTQLELPDVTVNVPRHESRTTQKKIVRDDQQRIVGVEETVV